MNFLVAGVKPKHAVASLLCSFLEIVGQNARVAPWPVAASGDNNLHNNLPPLKMVFILIISPIMKKRSSSYLFVTNAGVIDINHELLYII